MIEFPDLPAAQQADEGCSPHDYIARSLDRQARSRPDTPRGPRTVLFTTEDPEAEAYAWAREAMGGRPVSERPIWVRMHRVDYSQHLFAFVHGYSSPGEMELVVAAQRGMLGRVAIRFLAAWCFYTIGLHRVVVRIPTSRPYLADYARRVGFRFEGTARSFFGPGSDAAVWAMTPADCPWLVPGQRPNSSRVVPSPAGPSSSEKVH